MAEKNSAQTNRQTVRQTDTMKIMVTWPWTNITQPDAKKTVPNCDVSFAKCELHHELWKEVEENRNEVESISNRTLTRTDRKDLAAETNKSAITCGKRESYHWLVRCRNLRQRKSSKNKTTQGVNLYMQGGQPYEQRCGSL